MTEMQQHAPIAFKEKTNLLEWAISPYGATLLSSVIFFSAWLLPPSIYSIGLDEPDYLWLDQSSFFLFASCAIAFVLGVRLADKKVRFQRRSPIPAHIPPVPYILPPLVATLAFGLVGVLLILRAQPQIIIALLSGAGENIKGDLFEVALPAGIAAAGSAMLAVLYWGVNAYSAVPKGRNKKIIGRILAGYISISFAIAFIKFSRNDLMSLILGIMTIRIANGIRSGRTDIREVKLVAKALATMVALFLMISLLRGTSSDELLGNFFGYTISGYNRMAAIVHHQIPYLDAGNGDHLFNGILQNRTINNLFPFQAMYNLPDQLDVWLSDFTAVLGAGLMSQYTFASCFGFIFIDAGWWTPAVVFFCGVFSGHMWKRFKQNKGIGVVVYPMIFFTILMWFGTNTLISMNTIIFILTTAALLAYENLFKLLALATSGIRNATPHGIANLPLPPDRM
ncbi:O-antigen polymerase [Silvibacterium dinghuense]|uniref:Oligosaccharide repeat unit polymerase n=1 Tax=Silvibacterium dinghuense TaxID=1560006 RepID=A0A4Q1SEI2_9BACT|nr:O-antigen polymerase [Silvibacterium dinghuense]RXS95689.1 oligosaccharide repeat unit polymerase [Silvibacterium dinghuense]GGH14943.1 hypothetical protein GCM10011586_35730 [Silvibacterium dinghuense]